MTILTWSVIVGFGVVAWLLAAISIQLSRAAASLDQIDARLRDALFPVDSKGGGDSHLKRITEEIAAGNAEERPGR